MIEKITFKAGASKASPNLEMEVFPITIFVGPNNSGKSKSLVEIESFLRTTKVNSSDVIIDNLRLSAWEREDINAEITRIKLKPHPDERLEEGHIIIGKIDPQSNTATRNSIKLESLIRDAVNPYTPGQFGLIYYSTFLAMHTVRLDGRNRLSLLQEQPAGDLQGIPSNHLSHLFINNPLRSEVRRIIFDAFEKYFVVDPTNMGNLRIRLSDRAPLDESEERGWEEKAVNFHKDALLIDNASDGVKAFCGIITSIFAGAPKVILIDEPEAFLHPALSSKLGKEIGKYLTGSNKRLFASTHSSSFLMGCIQSGAPLNIVRLTYKNGVATSRLLPQEKVLHLMRQPLLRSTGVLNGLFYESVVVTESDSDRAFYQEINERLLACNDKRGIDNCLFVNAQNKQTVWDIVKPLRELGISVVGIVDIDVLKEGGQVFAKLLDGAFIPSLNHEAFSNQRAKLLQAFTDTGKDMKRNGGIQLLPKEQREACENFFNQLLDYGAFVVPNGELESWLKIIGATGHGSKWLIDIFSKIGDNPSDENYLKPTNGDVWDFIGMIKSWVDNPDRKGIPE